MRVLPSAVIFHQFLNDDLGCACYLVGDEEAGIAVVVDPPFAIDPILAEAAHRRVRIVRTVETHTHADHVSGHGRLALEHGVPVSIHAGAEVNYPHDPMHDGDEIEVGAVTLGVIHTPGHRPEHCCLTVIDRSRAGEPWLVLTGDSLFVGEIARPDLAVGATEGAEGLFHSLHRLLELSDGVEVFPGHIAGSLCGKSMSSKPSTTIGFERRFNPTLQLTEIQEFVANSAAVSTPKPPNLARIVEANRGPFLGEPPPARELAAPPPTSNCSTPGRSTPTSAATGRERSTFPSRARASRRRRDSCSMQRRRCASSRTRRTKHGRDRRAPLGRVLRRPRLRPRRRRRADQGGHGRRARGVIAAGAEVIDVREKDDRDTGYIPGSRNVPYRLLATCCPDLPADRPVVTICESGSRAAIAASILRSRGYDARPVVHGGMVEWRARGGDTVEFRRCGSP